MTKLAYPADGLHPRCRGHLEHCSQDLARATSGCDFNIPGDFPHRGYLSGLASRLNSLRNENNQIGTKIQATDRSFSALSDHLATSASQLTPSKVNQRDRLIV